MKETTKQIFQNFLSEHPHLLRLEHDILCAVDLLVDAFQHGGKLLVCGNGGSSADSDHIVGELMKGFVKKRQLDGDFFLRAKKLFGDDGVRIAENLQQGLPAISLTCQTALMTAFLNDCNPEFLYAQQVNAFMKPGDILLAISTSGNSKNVAHAARTARILGGRVIGLLGNTGGILKKLSDVAIVSPQSETYKIQEDHLPIYHLICLGVESEIFDK